MTADTSARQNGHSASKDQPRIFEEAKVNFFTGSRQTRIHILRQNEISTVNSFWRVFFDNVYQRISMESERRRIQSPVPRNSHLQEEKNKVIIKLCFPIYNPHMRRGCLN
uniref:Uncharacterized protein n=1 Tax=Compsopogon caeruleus TaxID=31354 RepID=A0A7S1TAV2_9RHOD|mmetsp:Transcript_15070/g.30602  ORF Transcript_15070/g.30602 Transcript_15070/m.30602 type:complete len:110 (+) Transcript_15070:104-433(+)